MDQIGFLTQDYLILKCEVCGSVSWHRVHFHPLPVIKRCGNKPSRTFNRFKSAVSRAGLFPEEEEAVVPVRVIGLNDIQGATDLLKQYKWL